MANWRKYFALFIWLSVLLLCFINKEKITIENILSYSPQNLFLAAGLMLLLFTVKGLTMAINGNILYMACGLMFSLPFAVTLNLAGTLVMTSISYIMGYRGGRNLMDKLVSKYKRMSILQNFPKKNEFLCTFMLRFFGVLPCEIVGMYLGACGLGYKSYIAGTALGLLPAVVCYAVMGRFMHNPGSPQFILALAVQLGTTVITLILGLLMRKKAKPKGIDDVASIL